MLQNTMIKSRDHKFISVLEKMAEDVVPVRSARIAAGIVLGDFISFGVNSTKTSPFQKRFSKHPRDTFWHAETNAIYNALKRGPVSDLMSSTLYIARRKYEGIGKNMSLVRGMAMPCSGCEKCLKTYGIKRIVFTLDDQTLGEWIND